MIEVVFLLVLAFVWIVIATISDIRTTEIPNWLPFSLIIFALGFRFFYSLFSPDVGFAFFYQGLIGLGIFIVLGNVLYYSRAFAGADSKLMMALGPIIPFSLVFVTNVEIFVSFLFLFLVSGAVYGLGSSVYLAARKFKDFKKEFKKRHKQYLKITIPFGAIGVGFMIFGLFYQVLVFWLGLMIFVMPLLYVFSKSVDEACMVWEVKPEKLMEGDWLYKDIRIGRKVIKANWDGLSSRDIKLLRKKSKLVSIRHGIVFTPVFLVSFLALIYFYFINNGLFLRLWYPFG